MKRIKAPETKAEANARVSKDGQPLFVKGGTRPEGAGRKKGQQNRTTVVLKDCIINAMEMVGNNNKGKDGASGYLAHLAWRHPDIFGKLLEKMLPFSLAGAGGGPVQIEYTNRDEIVLRMKERGLPIPPNLLEAPKRRIGKDRPTEDAEDAVFAEVEDASND